VPRFFLTAIFFFVISAVFAGSADRTTISDPVIIKRYSLLPDRGYSFDRILADTTLSFRNNELLRPAKASGYWLKLLVINPNHYDDRYYLRVSPYFDNTLYYWNAEAGKYIGERAGISVAGDDRRLKGMMPVALRAKSPTTLWVKINTGSSPHFTRDIKPLISFEKENITDSREAMLKMVWIVSTAVLFLLLLNNLYVYFRLRDKVLLYFVLGQAGGIIYLTTSRSFLAALVFCPPFSYGVTENGKTFPYNLNTLLMHAGVALIIYGFTELTRSYLNTGKTLPFFDLTLRYGLKIYLLVTAILVIINCFVAYIETDSLYYENILVVLILGFIVITSISGYLKKLPLARNFLVAISLPLVTVLLIAIKNIMISTSAEEFVWLPDAAVICQAIGVSMAIAARFSAMQRDLSSKEMAMQDLSFEIREIELERRVIELENKQISTDLHEMTLKEKSILALKQQKEEDFQEEKIRNELLLQKLEMNQRELASASLYMAQKNEMLASLKNQIKDLSVSHPGFKQSELQGINAILSSSQYLDEDWAKFKLHFEQVHPHFFHDLFIKYPTLTRNETRLYAYIHMKLSAKEIAALLNIDPTSVHRAKTRLLKKMALSAKNDA